MAALLFSCFLLYAVFSKNKTDRRALYLYLIFSTIVIAIGSISEYARDLSVEYADSLKSKLEEQTILNIKLRERISQLLDLIGEIDEKNSTIGIY